MTSPRLVALRELAEEAELERRDFIVEATELLRRFLRRTASGCGRSARSRSSTTSRTSCAITRSTSCGSRGSPTRTRPTGSGTTRSRRSTPLRAGRALQPGRHHAWLIEASRNPLDHLAPADELATEESAPAEAEDDWQNELPADQRETLAAQRLWQLADAYRSQLQEQQAALLREFVGNAEDALRLTGDLVLLDEQDDTLVLRGDGRFETTLNLADMPPRPVETIEAHRQGLTVTDAKTVAEFYDPADVLQWVTESLSERYPAVDFSAVYD